MSPRFSLLVLLVASVAQAEVVAFIGSPLAVRVNPTKCGEFFPPDVICMDRAFDLTYTVDEVLHGAVDNDTLQFVGFYHYSGMPDYTVLPKALVVIRRHKDFFVSCAIHAVEKRDSAWWVCDEWPENEEDECTVGRYASQVISDCGG